MPNEYPPWTPLRFSHQIESTKGLVKIYGNSRYTVAVRANGHSEDLGTLTHLSIHDHWRTTRHDWRDFQQIKNELCGPESEAVEIYPAESRLVDTSNEYHL